MIRTVLFAGALLALPQEVAAEVCDKEVGYGQLDDFEMACEQFSRSTIGKAWRAADWSIGREITVFSKEILFTTVEGYASCTACVATCRVKASEVEDETGSVLFDSAFLAGEYSAEWYKCLTPGAWSAHWIKVMQ